MGKRSRRRVLKVRSPTAKALESPIFRSRKVPSAKTYKRKVKFANHPHAVA